MAVLIGLLHSIIINDKKCEQSVIENKFCNYAHFVYLVLINVQNNFSNELFFLRLASKYDKPFQSQFKNGPHTYGSLKYGAQLN